jgi:REP element-mobilizing transposase RayT
MSYTKLLYHLVFGTKERTPMIDKSWRPDLHAYLGGETRGLKGTALEVGGVEDHVHLLVDLPPTIALSDFMSKLKANSSSWGKRKSGKQFSWAAGYGAFTVSESKEGTIRDYIRTQEEHHRRFNFEVEYRALLRKHNIKFDERYLWTP